MTLLEQLSDLVVGRLTFPLVNYALNRGNMFDHYRSLARSERYSEGLLTELQLQKLNNVLQYAYTWCQHYREKLDKAKIAPGEIRTLEDLKQLPPLTRQEVIEHHYRMVDSRYQSSILVAEQTKQGPGLPIYFARFRKHKLVRNVSTGSTGIPTTFYEDGSTTALNWARELRVKRWYGLGPGAREARFARVSTEYLPNSKLLWARQLLWHQLILPGMNLSDRDYELSLRKIQRFRPRILWGITTALTGFAAYVRRSKTDVVGWRPQLVITWAAPLYEHEKKLLTEVFGCPVTNIYGSREVGHVAALCPQGSLHINQEDFIVEIESDNGPGEILITPLDISPMPFLRYRIGDVGELARGDCPCGRSLQVLKSLLGRTGEVYITRDGQMIAPNFWCRMFMLGRQSQTVERFQVVYQKNGSIHFRIVRKPNYSAETEADLRRFLAKNFSSDMRFKFEYVGEIKPEPSGKYKLVVKELTQ